MTKPALPVKYGLVCVLGLVLTYIVTELIAYRNAWKTLEISARVPVYADCEVAIVVGRRVERTSLDDTETPFRNSILAVYKRSGKRWTKVGEDIACRATSTALNPAEGADYLSAVTSAVNTGRPYVYGYESVPDGNYCLTSSTIKNRDGYLISEWNRGDGRIQLSSPQTLVKTTFPNVKDGNLTTSETVISASLEKSMCFIHGTKTQIWSRVDALGCITVSNATEDNAASKQSDWEQTTFTLETLHKVGYIGLFVQPYETLSTEPDSLPAVLEEVENELLAPLTT